MDNIQLFITPALEAYRIGLTYRNTRTSCLGLAQLCAQFSHDSLRRVLALVTTALDVLRGTVASPVWHNYIQISWAPITLNTSFGSLVTDPNPVNNTVVWQPWFLTYPSGANTRFFYTSYGQMYLVEKWAPTVSGQGQERRIAYTRYDLPSVNDYSAPAGAGVSPGSANNNAVQTDCPQFANRYEWAEYWNNSAVATYAYNFNTAANYTTITDPLGRLYRTDLNPGSNPQIVVSRMYTNATSYNNGNGTPLKTISTTYSKDTGPSYTANQRVSQAEITDGSFTRKTAISYNTTAIAGVALPSDVDEYNAAGTAVYRRRHTDYNTNSAYLTRHIYGLPSASLAYSGAGTTLLAKSENLYDESTYYLNSSGDNVIRHDLTNYGASFILGRGNLTTTRQYSVTGGVASSPRDLGHTKFDTQGNAREATDAAGNISYIEMWDNFSNKPSGTGETHAMVNRVISPGKVANAATTVQNGATYDWYTGNVTESFHIQGTTWGGAHQNVVTYTYDSSGRRIGEYRPDGGWTTFNYWENWRAFATYTLLETGKQRYSFTSFDGADRAIWQGGDHPNGTAGWFTGQQMGYDNAGRQNKSTNPTAMNGSFVAIDDDPNDGVAASFEWTNLTLDALDRPTLITRPDNNTVSYNYTGCGCAGSSTIEITDERGKKRKTVNDHLGRLKEAYDLYANGTTYGKAVYTLNELDQMTKIEHYNNGSAHQDRSFAYDGYGRLTSQTIPETGTTSYNYTALDQVQTVTLANTRTRSFTYEARGLLTDIDYNGTDTQDVHYDYDEYGARTLMQEKNPSTGTVESSTSYTYNAYEQLQTETRNFKGLAGTFKLDYQYNLAGLLKTMTYTVGSWVKNVNYAYNYAGAVTGIGTNIRSGAASNDTTNVANTFNYRGFGAVRTMTYGNGQVMNAIYNAKRLQMTNQTWQKSGTVIVNKSYDYNNGGNNNGRIQKITDNVDAGYTTTYGYDDFNRLTSASNANYTRSYTYDEWANLKSVTATGLGESGSYTFPAYATKASGAPETNRVNYVWSSYDAAGNMQYDGNHNFYYDAANRIRSVDNNKPQEYDGDGRRVKNNEDAGGNITLYYLWSSVLGQVVADLGPGFYTNWGIPYRAYVYSPGGARVAQQSYDTGFTWIHNDHLGSSHKGTDSTGALVWRDELDPHGQWAYGWSPQGGYYHSRKFTGYERDYGSGTHHANARQYHHNNNRFMQADPLGLAASDLRNPQSLNLYSYVQNDPVNFVDPSGTNIEAPDDREWEILCILGWSVACDKLKERKPGGDIGGGDIGGGGGGDNTQKIPDCAKEFFASLFPELNLNDVVIHDGLPEATKLNTIGGVGAITIGNHIYFPKGVFNLNYLKNNKGFAILGHELVHVRQYNALGVGGFVKRYVAEYVFNAIVANLTYDIVGGSYPILQKAYENISLESSAYEWEDKMEKWLEGKPGRRVSGILCK